MLYCKTASGELTLQQALLQVSSSLTCAFFHYICRFIAFCCDIIILVLCFCMRNKIVWITRRRSAFFARMRKKSHWFFFSILAFTGSYTKSSLCLSFLFVFVIPFYPFSLQIFLFPFCSCFSLPHSLHFSRFPFLYIIPPLRLFAYASSFYDYISSSSFYQSLSLPPSFILNLFWMLLRTFC